MLGAYIVETADGVWFASVGRRHVDHPGFPFATEWCEPSCLTTVFHGGVALW
jgi:hypothetical protein